MPYGGGNLDSEASLASASTSSAAASFFDLAHAVHEALPDDVANVLRKFPQDRNDGDIRVVKMWLKHLPVSSVRRFLFVPGSVGNEIAQHLQLLAAGRDTLIYRQGEVGDKFYVIWSGACEVFRNLATGKGSSTSPSGGAIGGSGLMLRDQEQARLGPRVGILPEGECFGERSIGGSRECTIISRGSELLYVTNAVFTRCILPVFRTVEELHMKRAAFMGRLSAFSTLPQLDLEFLAYWAHQRTVPVGHTLYEAGDPIDGVYFLMDGAVNLSEVVRPPPKGAAFRRKPVNPDDSGDEAATNAVPGVSVVIETVLSPGFFGELEILEGHATRAMTATVVEFDPEDPDDQSAELCCLPFAVLQTVLTEEATRIVDTKKRLVDAAVVRDAWRRARIADVGSEVGSLHFSLLYETQCHFLGCQVCGEKHMVRDCPVWDPEEADRPAQAPAAAVVASPVPHINSPLTIRAPSSITPLPPSEHSPRIIGGRSPMTRRDPLSESKLRSVVPDEEDWNQTVAPTALAAAASGGPSVKDARASIMAVFRAVRQFKRLLERRRARERGGMPSGPEVPCSPTTRAARAVAFKNGSAEPLERRSDSPMLAGDLPRNASSRGLRSAKSFRLTRMRSSSDEDPLSPGAPSGAFRPLATKQPPVMFEAAEATPPAAGSAPVVSPTYRTTITRQPTMSKPSFSRLFVK